jgi:hypothetical protein
VVAASTDPNADPSQRLTDAGILLQSHARPEAAERSHGCG